VKVLDLAEFDLHLDLVPVNGLREQLDIDALLMGDLKSILVDKRAFMSPRLEYRLRFSVAHEIGHLILHRDIYAGLQHATAAEWFDYISAIPEVEYGWVEWQAYEFAGRLLVPPEPLREAFQAAIQSAQAAGYSDWLAADEAALDYIATRIAPKFVVPVGNRSDRIVAAAAEKVECPDVYDGKFGMPIFVLMLGSNCEGRGLK